MVTGEEHFRGVIEGDRYPDISVMTASKPSTPAEPTEDSSAWLGLIDLTGHWLGLAWFPMQLGLGPWFGLAWLGSPPWEGLAWLGFASWLDSPTWLGLAWLNWLGSLTWLGLGPWFGLAWLGSPPWEGLA